MLDEIRKHIALIVLGISITGLIVLSVYIIKPADTETSKYVFNAVLPLIGTWVGVVLAFYFGKENFEAASNKYERIIQKLTPDLLDDIKVNQIMISKKTMVSKRWDDIQDKTVREIIEFLEGVDKSRLPVLEGESVKFIIHASLLTKPIQTDGQIMVANLDETMNSFVKRNDLVVGKIIWVEENTILETVRKKMANESNSKDVFVRDTDGKLVGWLTDTLILRYINSTKNQS